MRSSSSFWARLLSVLSFRSPNRSNRAIHSKSKYRRPQFEACEDRRMLAAFVVNVTTDPATFNLSDTVVSLREAVFSANQNDDQDTIRFDPSLSGATITLTQGQMGITSPVAIEAATASGVPLANKVTIDAQFTSRIFNVSFTTASMKGLKLTGGAGEGDGYGGGAIYSVTFALTLTDCEFTDNRTSFYGGGAIDCNGGVLTVANCTFTNNRATSEAPSSEWNTHYGGAIHARVGGVIDDVPGQLIISNCRE